MSSNAPHLSFKSSLAPLMEQFVREKRAVGYKYEVGAVVLMHLDRFLAEQAPADDGLSRSAVRKWPAKDPLEGPRTQQARFTAARQFAEFLRRLDRPAYVPDGSLRAKGETSYQPHIFTHAEVRKLLHEADRLPPISWSPVRHLVMPEIFRLLYGLRVPRRRSREAADGRRRPQPRRPDRARGQVRQGSSGAARPVTRRASSLLRRGGQRSSRPQTGRRVFLPITSSASRTALGRSYTVFRQLLCRSGIPHPRRRQGTSGPRPAPLVRRAHHAALVPRRRGFSTRSFPSCRPIMGHLSLLGTERYLHLTAELFPEVAVRVNAAFGDIIPRSVPS